MVNLEIVHEGPIEYIEYKKRDRKSYAWTSVDPIGDFLRCHCRPSGFLIGIGFRCTIVVYLQRCGAGWWFHIHTNVGSIFLDQIVHTLCGCNCWHIIFTREALKRTNKRKKISNLFGIFRHSFAKTVWNFTCTVRKLLKLALPWLLLPPSMLEHDRDFCKPALMSLRAGFGVSVDFKMYLLFTYFFSKN